MGNKIKTSTISKGVFTAFLALILVISCQNLTQQIVPTDALSACSSTVTAPEFNSWFESGTVSLDGAVKPANSVTFPDVPNCSFYKWSEQMFLWITSPAPARYNSKGLVLNSPAFFDVSPPNGGVRTLTPHEEGKIRVFNIRTAQRGALGLPVIMERKTLRLLEILNPVLSPAGKQVVINAQGQEVEISKIQFNQDKRPVFFDLKGTIIERPRAILESKTFLQSTDVKQTISLTKKLERFPNFDKTSLVQKFTKDKEIIFLDLFGNVVNVEQGQADGGVLIAQNGSLVYYSLSVNEVFAYFRTMQGNSFSDPSVLNFPTTQTDLNNITTFATAHGRTFIDPEALAIEVKSSWVEAAGLMDSDKFIKMKATVPTYDKTNPALWVPNGEKTVELAMVGMHVVGSTKGHPEMLWGTFEHLSNDPSAAYTYTKTPSGTTTIPQSTVGNWVFCANNAVAPFNQAHSQMSGLNVEATTGNTISPTNILRTMPWGMDGSSSGSNAQVININNSVRTFIDPNDIRKNYIQTGTTWTKFGSDPNFPNSNQVGTNKLSNTTMETFSQGGNCFGCHNSNKTDVSHVFREIKPLF